MSEVTLQIGGRSYRVACSPGEEMQVEKLGAIINDKLASMGQLGPQDAQNMLFAALLLADELQEARTTGERTAGELAAAQAEIATAGAAERARLEERTGDLENRLFAANEEVKAARRDADTANGKRDSLAGRIADLEGELSRLQSAQQRSASDMDEAHARIAQLAQDIADSEGTEGTLRAEIAMLVQERDRLASQPAAAPASSPGQAAELAPALERFADLLEKCADQLEGAAPAS